MAGVPDAKDLGKLELFRGLSAAELTQVNDLLGRTKFPAGAMILTADQPGEIAYVILEGTLKVSTIQGNGRELTLALLGPGEIVGELALADRAARSADVTALEPSVLVWLACGSPTRSSRRWPRSMCTDASLANCWPWPMPSARRSQTAACASRCASRSPSLPHWSAPRASASTRSSSVSLAAATSSSIASTASPSAIALSSKPTSTES